MLAYFGWLLDGGAGELMFDPFQSSLMPRMVVMHSRRLPTNLAPAWVSSDTVMPIHPMFLP
jgi:hypothetical protein